MARSKELLVRDCLRVLVHVEQCAGAAMPVGGASYYLVLFFFFFNDTATTEIYTLSLHDALPISVRIALA